MASTGFSFRISTLVVCLLALGSINPSAVVAQSDQYRAPKSSDGPLRWQFQKGQVFSTVLDQTIIMSANIPGQPEKTSQHIITEMTLRVLEVSDDGTAKANSTIDRMAITIEAGGNTLKYDTDAEGEAVGPMAEVGKLIKPMIGKAITQDMSPSGKVSNVKIPEGMIDTSGNPLAASFLNKKSLETMSSSGSLEFPSENPEVGKAWQKVMDLDVGTAKIQNTTDYTYVGVKEGKVGPLHVIQGKLTQKFPGGVAPGVDIKVVREDSTALFQFDGINGYMRGSEVSQDVTTQISAQGQTFQQRIHQIAKTTFEEKTDSPSP